ncbi:hypothetical protein G6F22_016632 [Rhizopus arrhizus]|nr:hypothetical protein G6F22_016632 [Rhizopus arrhizus]
MAIAIVVELEAVGIQEQQRQRLAVAPCGLPFAGQRFIERAAIGDAGQAHDLRHDRQEERQRDRNDQRGAPDPGCEDVVHRQRDVDDERRIVDLLERVQALDAVRRQGAHERPLAADEELLKILREIEFAAHVRQRVGIADQHHAVIAENRDGVAFADRQAAEPVAEVRQP